MSTHFKRILYGGDYNPNQWPKDIWQGDMRIFKDAHINTAAVTMPARILLCLNIMRVNWHINWQSAMQTIHM